MRERSQGNLQTRTGVQISSISEFSCLRVSQCFINTKVMSQGNPEIQKCSEQSRAELLSTDMLGVQFQSRGTQSGHAQSRDAQSGNAWSAPEWSGDLSIHSSFFNSGGGSMSSQQCTRSIHKVVVQIYC